MAKTIESRIERLEKEVTELNQRVVTLADLVLASKTGDADGLVVYAKEMPNAKAVPGQGAVDENGC